MGGLRSETCIDARCRYDEIRDLYIKQLAFTWMEESTTEATRTNVNEQIDIFAKDAPEHATEIVLALLKIADEDGDTISPAHTEVREFDPVSPPPRLDIKCWLHASTPR